MQAVVGSTLRLIGQAWRGSRLTPEFPERFEWRLALRKANARAAALAQRRAFMGANRAFRSCHLDHLAERADRSPQGAADGVVGEVMLQGTQPGLRSKERGAAEALNSQA